MLIVRVGAMGDVLHALPGVAALRAAEPECGIDWVVEPRWAPLLVNAEQKGPVVDRVLLAETRLWRSAPLSGATLRSIAGLRRAIRAERYDAVVDMQGTLRSAVIGRLAKVENFAGYADPREAAAARMYRRPLKRRGTHVVEQGVALLGEAYGLTLEPAAVMLPEEGWAEAWAEELVGTQRVCVLAASAGWGAKQWPAEGFGQLARELREEGFTVMVNATRREDPVARQVAEASGGAAEVVVCSVAGLMALLRRTAVLVGGDSGPTHLAAALGVPLVGLYGPTDPARNGPWGPGPKRVLRDAASVTSYKRRAEVDPGLARMEVAEVLGAVREVLG
ncbi:MAG TPA: lipopolysaccharide heptosyltransferase I [Acidobacteriaceae bacterium]|nr:lipopolysaccharide heptosyltransferase I [Acidobacteriaceae bacterium]